MSEKRAYYSNEGHIHEVLDRLSVAQDQLDRALIQHPLVQAVPAFENRVQNAIEILAELYQEVGSFDSIAEISKVHKVER